MLIGSYEGSLNEKRRITVPKKFLEELGKEPILAKWYEECLVLVSKNFWEELLNRLTGGTRALGIGVRDIERFILGSAYEMTPDELGRIVIPDQLAKYAHLNKEVVFIGLTNRIEIWKKEIWDEKSQELSKVTKEYIEKLSSQPPVSIK